MAETIDPFYDDLLIEPELELQQLRTTPQEFYKEARKKVVITARVLRHKRALAVRENELVAHYSEQKKEDKSFTEKVISSLISNDPKMVNLTNTIDSLQTAEQLQTYKMESMRMKHSALKVMAENVRTENLLSGGADVNP